MPGLQAGRAGEEDEPEGEDLGGAGCEEVSWAEQKDVQADVRHHQEGQDQEGEEGRAEEPRVRHWGMHPAEGLQRERQHPPPLPA